MEAATAAPSDPVPIGIVGAGSRASLYLRVAREVPDRFNVVGVVARRADVGASLERAWGVPTYRESASMLREQKPAFTVLAVPPAASAVLLSELADLDAAVLAETPPATTVDELDGVCALVDQGARIQVAEQCRFRPMHAARRAVIASGRIGRVSQAHVSVAHGYHGVNLIREYLGVGRDDVTIEASAFTSTLAYGPDDTPNPLQTTWRREGSLVVSESRQVFALVRFGDLLGVYDFTFDQYFSRSRSDRVLIRGERGEICGSRVSYVSEDGVAVETRLRRLDGGRNDDLDGYSHRGVLLGEELIYRSPFPGARLSDDEIAAGECLVRMVEYLSGGAEFSSVRDAAHDRHLALEIERATQAAREIEVPARF